MLFQGYSKRWLGKSSSCWIKAILKPSVVMGLPCRPCGSLAKPRQRLLSGDILPNEVLPVDGLPVGWRWLDEARFGRAVPLHVHPRQEVLLLPIAFIWVLFDLAFPEVRLPEVAGILFAPVRTIPPFGRVMELNRLRLHSSFYRCCGSSYCCCRCLAARWSGVLVFESLDHRK